MGQKKDRQRIVARFQSLMKNPRFPVCEKLAGSTDFYRLRIRCYRVVSSVEDQRAGVMIFKVGHR